MKLKAKCLEVRMSDFISLKLIGYVWSDFDVGRVLRQLHSSWIDRTININYIVQHGFSESAVDGKLVRFVVVGSNSSAYLIHPDDAKRFFQKIMKRS